MSTRGLSACAGLNSSTLRSMPNTEPWRPLPVGEVVSLLAGAPFRWWISGGHALEFHLGRSWRDHADTDVGVVRSESDLWFNWLSDRELFVAAGGALNNWDGRPLGPGENNVWVRRGNAWEIDLTVGSGDADEWIYRRGPSIRRPWRNAVLYSAAGVPYLAPDLQILFKSKSPRPKDDADAGVVIPLLGVAEREFLTTHLPDHHPWQRLLASV